MRVTLARLAKQAGEKYLTPGNPTGLAGLPTHPAPRATLISVYNQTLDSLSRLPSSSAYRTSAEALTRHRLSVLAAVRPEGHDAWLQRVRAKHPDAVAAAEKQGREFAVEPEVGFDFDERLVSWNNEPEDEGTEEGPWVKGQKIRLDSPEKLEAKRKDAERELIELEPPLSADQVSEIEQKIGAGLIEEIVEVAKGELKLIDVLAEHKVWEELDEKTPEGQWSYFERSARHTAGDPR